MKITLHKILIFILSCLGIALLTSYLGALNWTFDLFSHFIFQYLILTIITLVVCAFIKKYKTILYFSPILALLTFSVFSIYFGGNKNIELQNTVKISCINILSSNKNYKDVGAYIENESPDILILLEMNRLWETNLESSLLSFPNKLVINRTDNFGIAMYSKLPLSNIRKELIGTNDTPSITADFLIDNKKTTLLATHTLPPMGPEQFFKRNNQLEAITEFRKKIKNGFILVGDLNTSSYSYHFNKLLKESNLVDSRKGFGILSTWPTWMPLAYTTLDHCLISKGIMVKSRDVGNQVGSDHFPINIELGYN